MKGLEVTISKATVTSTTGWGIKYRTGYFRPTVQSLIMIIGVSLVIALFILPLVVHFMINLLGLRVVTGNF